MTLDTFEAMLQRHDWHYQYAEGKAYYEGKASDNAIMQAIIDLNKQGLSAESKALWLKHKPTIS
jgi:arginyl-tRNA--protein-N-Asp/Glu arginylyltransferase